MATLRSSVQLLSCILGRFPVVGEVLGGGCRKRGGKPEGERVPSPSPPIVVMVVTPGPRVMGPIKGVVVVGGREEVVEFTEDSIARLPLIGELGE